MVASVCDAYMRRSVSKSLLQYLCHECVLNWMARLTVCNNIAKKTVFYFTLATVQERILKYWTNWPTTSSITTTEKIDVKDVGETEITGS